MRSTKKIQLDFSILNPFYTATDNNRFHLIRALARPLPPSLCSCCWWMPPCPLEVNFLHMINLQSPLSHRAKLHYFWWQVPISYNSSTSMNVIISSTRWQNEVRRGGDGSIQLWHFVICKPITITYVQCRPLLSKFYSSWWSHKAVKIQDRSSSQGEKARRECVKGYKKDEKDSYLIISWIKARVPNLHIAW